MTDEQIDFLLGTARVNAALGWLLVGVIGSVAVASVLAGDPIWAGFAAAVGALAVVPAVAFRSWRMMLPWEVLVLAGLPIIGRLVTAVELNSKLATYLSVAALALIVAVEIHAFTGVRMTSTFAVAFVIVATMATVGIWAVVRYALDATLGTTFLIDPALTDAAIEREVMLEFVASTVAGLLAGIVFELYVRRQAVPDPVVVPRQRPDTPGEAAGAGDPDQSEAERGNRR